MSHMVTIELPDTLYERFKVRSPKTKRSLEQELLTAFALELPTLPLAQVGEIPAFNEVIEFLASGPSTSAIVQFQLSSAARQRAKTLLLKDREAGLTEAESKELDFYMELGDFLGVLRSKAQLQLQSSPNQ
jgi:hypothetical protein